MVEKGHLIAVIQSNIVKNISVLLLIYFVVSIELCFELLMANTTRWHLSLYGCYLYIETISI